MRFFAALTAFPCLVQWTKLAHSLWDDNLMRYFLLPSAAVVLFTLASSSTTSAQRHEIPPLNSCIKEFYDPEMYNYLTFKNSCSQSLTVVLIAKDGSGTSGTMELRPGGKDSVGRSAGKEPKPGSFELYVCPTGNIPVDDNNQLVSKPRSSFRCRQKTSSR